MYLRLAEDRGFARMHDGGIESFHSFSFGHYWDKNHMGYSALRVINDDVFKPQQGFDTHEHSDMEILTYVTKGALTHEDTLGHKEVIQAGHVQLMRAGTGIAHSEFNASKTDSVKLLQIWIKPNKKGLKPAYGTMMVPPHEGLKLIANNQPNAQQQGHLYIAQDAQIFIGHESRDAEIVYNIAKGRQIYMHLIRGELCLNEAHWLDEEVYLAAGDGLGLKSEHDKLHIHALKGVEYILFDLPEDVSL